MEDPQEDPLVVHIQGWYGILGFNVALDTV